MTYVLIKKIVVISNEEKKNILASDESLDISDIKTDEDRNIPRPFLTKSSAVAGRDGIE